MDKEPSIRGHGTFRDPIVRRTGQTRYDLVLREGQSLGFLFHSGQLKVYLFVVGYIAQATSLLSHVTQ